MKRVIRILLYILVFFTFLNPAFSQEKKGLFRDSLDSAFDISKFLLDLHGFLPLISPVTEPAVGYGLVATGVYFIPKEKSSPAEFKMPDIIGAGGGYTQNGTWFGGAGYAGFWRDNTVRYRGVTGYGSIILKYFGAGDNILAEDPAEFSIESFFLLQQALFRIGKSRFMVGGNYIFSSTEVTAFEESKLPSVDPREFDLINSGITLLGEYETLNNILSPTRGIRVQLGYRAMLEMLGSDLGNQRLNFFTLAYLPLTDRWVSGFRVESLLASGDTPFYMMPYVSLRGVPLMRYQGQLTMLAETEQYVNIFRRWGLVGFAGYGRTVTDIEVMDQGVGAWNVGGGFRYLIARLLGLQMGLDVARGPEDWAFYVVFGSAWMK